METCINNRNAISYVDLYNPIYLENILNDGRSIPIVGFATGEGDDSTTEVAVKYAIEVGYRHMDCAWFQGNEKAVGSAIQDAIKQGLINRENLFITTKEKSGLWPDNEGPGVFSDVDYLETWEQLSRLLGGCKISQTVNQVEVNPLNSQVKLIKFCRDLDVGVVAYHPFGKLADVRNSGFPDDDNGLVEIGRRYNKTAAQVILRYPSNPGEVTEAVKTAIDVGYRHIDCAWFYKNENEVGQAIKEKIAQGVVKREDLFITSKLWNNFHAKDKVVPMLKESLKALKLDFLDLYLIHWPFGFKEEADALAQPDGYSDVDYLETWEGMEQCVKLGLAKSIGISNFNAEQTERLLKHCNVKPVCNQVEVNPNLNQKKLIQFSKERDIVVVGYCPLGRVSEAARPNMPQPTILDPKVAEIGKKYNKSPAQAVLNYLISLGISVIPKSVTKSRIIENFNVLDFTLSPEDTAYLDSCNKNKRVALLPQFSDHKYYSFHSEF